MFGRASNSARIATVGRRPLPMRARQAVASPAMPTSVSISPSASRSVSVLTAACSWWPSSGLRPIVWAASQSWAARRSTSAITCRFSSSISRMPVPHPSPLLPRPSLLRRGGARDAGDRHVQAGRLAAAERPLQRWPQLLRALDVLGVATERLGDLVVAGRQQIRGDHPILAVHLPLAVTLGGPAGVV